MCFPIRARIFQCCQDLRSSSPMPCTIRPAAVHKPCGVWMLPPAHGAHRYLVAGTHICSLLMTLFVYSPPPTPSRRLIFTPFSDLPALGRLSCRRGTGHPAHLVGCGADYRDDSGTSGREAASSPIRAQPRVVVERVTIYQVSYLACRIPRSFGLYTGNYLLLARLR